MSGWKSRATLRNRETRTGSATPYLYDSGSINVSKHFCQKLKPVVIQIVLRMQLHVSLGQNNMSTSAKHPLTSIITSAKTITVFADALAATVNENLPLHSLSFSYAECSS